MVGSIFLYLFSSLNFSLIMLNKHLTTSIENS